MQVLKYNFIIVFITTIIFLWQQLKTLLNQKIKNVINYYNNKEHRMLKTTPNLYHEMVLTAAPRVAPTTVLAVRNNNTSPIEDVLSVNNYKQKIVEMYESMQIDIDVDTLNTGEKAMFLSLKNFIANESRKQALLTTHINTNLFSKLDDIQEAINNLKKKKEKIKHCEAPLRDPVFYDHFLIYLDVYPKPTKNKKVNSYATLDIAQYRVALVLLYISGARANEIKNLTYENIMSSTKNGRIVIFQSKQKTQRIVPIISDYNDLFNSIREDIYIIFELYGLKFFG